MTHRGPEFWLPDALRQRLVAIAQGGAAAYGEIAALARQYERSATSLHTQIHKLRKAKVPSGTPWREHYRLVFARPCLHPDGPGADGVPALGVVPSPAAAPAAASGQRGVLDVSSLNLGARGESRTVAPAPGAADPAAPGAVFSGPSEPPHSPGLQWAWQMLERGVPLEKLLRTGGDRLTWRDRAALRGEAA